ncbi:MAG: tripartite tricarboxylate transporter substrate binding protein [Betaproteobacteria bacterium]|nr:MAG: tripartite tricarboxylate transporter substrate binding protein [Betaproteobacteria bacterium]
MTRKAALKCMAAALFAAVVPQLQAQPYPSGPINLVIPLAAGDATDTAARAIADELARDLKVAIVPVNRPGAAGALGADLVVKAPKDGHTILLANNASLIFRTILDPSVATYDPFRDFTPLGLAMRSPSILVAGAEQPFKTFKEMAAYAKSNPVRIGTAGVGSVGHFCVNTIAKLTGTELTMVPFTGATPAVTAVRGGHVEGVILALGAMTGQIRSGAVRPLVISTKSDEFPGIPTLSELGFPEPLFGVWTAFFAPAGLPAEITAVLVPALERAIKAPSVLARLKPLGIVPDYAPPEKLLAEIRDEHRRVSEMAKQAGLVRP